VRSLGEFARRKEIEKVFLEDTRKAFRTIVQTEEKKRAASRKKNLIERKKMHRTENKM